MTRIRGLRSGVGSQKRRGTMRPSEAVISRPSAAIVHRLSFPASRHPTLQASSHNGDMKMNVKIWITTATLLVCSVVFFQSCTTSKTMKMAPVSTPDQKTGYDGTITSHKKHFVSLSPYNRFMNIYSKTDFLKDKTMFILTVQNGGEKPIQVGYDNITVVFEGNDKEGALNKIAVQKSDDFLNHWENEYNDSEKKFVYSVIHYTYVCAEMAACDPMELLENLKYNLEAMRRQNQALRETLPEILVVPQRLMPGDNLNGIFICDTTGMDANMEGKFRIIVSVDGEEHKFNFKRSLTK
jgi:hypothetical protein